MTIARMRTPGDAASAGQPPAQVLRRRRILDVAVGLASKGGYDAVQMRAVADGAQVALATLYRYFPSKIHLLVVALQRELTRAQDRLDRAILRGDSGYDRLIVVIGGVTRLMQRDPLLTEALTRAVMFADRTAAAEVDAAREQIDAMFAHAIADAAPSADQWAIARVISDVWLSNMVAWVTGRASAHDVAERLELTASMVLGRRRSAR